MTETIQNNHELLKTQISGYYLEETPKAISIRLPHGAPFWVPKRHIGNNINKSPDINQKFIIDKWILEKIGFRL